VRGESSLASEAVVVADIEEAMVATEEAAMAATEVEADTEGQATLVQAAAIGKIATNW
jgi:hypothetical protein